jgi:hypothetical protein
MNMPGFNADGSLYKASERYAAVTSFAQTERAGPLLVFTRKHDATN